MSKQTALYRFYDADENLLYVGTTDSIRRRWGQHARDKPWWPSVVYTEITWYGTRMEAELHEQQAIADECPPFNRNMPPWRIGVSMTMQAKLRAFHDLLAAEVFIALEDGCDLETVARAARWSPTYIVKLRARRRPSWARKHVANIRDGKVAADKH